MQIFPKKKKQDFSEHLDKIKTLETSLQHAIDIIVAQPDRTESYKGNQFTSYAGQVEEIDKMYNGTADWGNQITRNIIDVRAAFALGSGVKLKKVNPKVNADREMLFLKDFMSNNNIDFWRSIQWGTESEIEGKFLCSLSPDKTKNNVRVKFIEWTANRYEVHTDPDDYSKYTKVTYTSKKTSNVITLKTGQFIYKKFAGRESKVNETTPKVGMIITTIKDLDKAQWDWRKINHLFASPTPYFKCETEAKAKATDQALKDANWKIGKKLVSVADFSMVSSDMGGSLSLENEIKTKAKFVSGGTGVPVHFIGFVDLMSNRATAENLMELLFASTNKERNLWIDTYNDMLDLAIDIQNESNNGGLQKGLIEAEIPYVSSAKLKELADIWLPIHQEGGISLDTFLSKIPDIDVIEEKNRIKDDRDNARNDFLREYSSTEEAGSNDEN